MSCWLCSWCILIYKKGNIFDGSFIYPVSWRHHKTASCTTCLYGKYFQRTLSSALSRGVPLDCGCKGRYFLHTDQTLLPLFFEKNERKIIIRWFSNMTHFRNFWEPWRNWQIYVAKHKNWAVFRKMERCLKKSKSKLYYRRFVEKDETMLQKRREDS